MHTRASVLDCLQTLPHLTVMAEYVGVVKTGSELDSETAAREDGLGTVMVDKVKTLVQEQTRDGQGGPSSPSCVFLLSLLWPAVHHGAEHARCQSSSQAGGSASELCATAQASSKLCGDEQGLRTLPLYGQFEMFVSGAGPGSGCARVRATGWGEELLVDACIVGNSTCLLNDYRMIAGGSPALVAMDEHAASFN